MTKRQKFVLSSLILASGFFSLQFIETDSKYQAISLLTLLSALFTAWAIRDGLGKNATLLVLVLPAMFTAGVGLFYFLLPSSILTQVPILFLYALGIYALLLTSNIYTVAASRTIALLRAAHAVGFILTLLTSFLLFDTVFSLRSDFWVNGLLCGLISFPLMLQGLWAVDLEATVSKDILYTSFACSLIAGQVASILSFWPITVPVASLALTTVIYIGLGLGQARLQQRLFAKTVREYFIVGAIVAVTMFLTARWGG